MRSVTWPDRARPIIAAVLAETKGQNEKAIRRALFDAYPFGPRDYYPYAVWLDEIKRQRGLKPPTKQAMGEPCEPGGLLALMEEE